MEQTTQEENRIFPVEGVTYFKKLMDHRKHFEELRALRAERQDQTRKMKAEIRYFRRMKIKFEEEANGKQT